MKTRKPRVDTTPLMNEVIKTLFINGISYRDISSYLSRHFDIKISHQGLFKRCRKFDSSLHRERGLVTIPNDNYIAIANMPPDMLTRSL